MTTLFQENKEASKLNIEKVSKGPRVNFLEGYAVAYEAGVRASSQYGMEETARKIEQENYDKLRACNVASKFH